MNQPTSIANPFVAAFLSSYEDGPGATTPDQTHDLVGLVPAVDRMAVSDTPFAHGIIDDFLPGELYEAVLRDWPPESSLATVTLANGGDDASDYFGSRTTKLLENWADDGDGTPAAGTWNRVCLALRSPAFVRRLFTAFADVVETNLRNLNMPTSSVPSFKLYANFDHGAKEALGAHIDAMRKLLTIVVYLDLTGTVDEDSSRRWGTALYETDAGAVRPLQFSANADHAVARQLHFAPNRAFVMPNDSRALHGVAGGQAGVARRTLMCGYWLMGR